MKPSSRAATSWLVALACLATTALSAESLTDREIRQRIIEQSLAAYPGNCPCPYNLDRAGRKCGRRSAYSKAGGYAPMCFETDVTDDQVREFRRRHATRN